jgi:uncharacterized protein DUF1236
MTNRLMISVAAAALIAGTGLANAQGTGMGREAPSAGSTTQQSAPSSERGATSAAPMNREAAEPAGRGSDMKSTQTEEKAPAGKNMKGEKSAQDNMGQKPKTMSSDNDNAKGGKDMKAEGREGGRTGNMNAETKGTDSKSQTTGQAGAGGKLSGEQRTKITTVIRSQHVQPVEHVNFSISVGTRVPREGVSFHPLPAEIVTIYPDWRGYEFILVGQQIVVVDPRTFEIVAVIDA